MKKSIFIIFFIAGIIPFSVAQKMNLTYKIVTNNSVLIFKDKAYSDKNIETKAWDLFQKYVANTDILSIHDNLNRDFLKFKTDNKIIYIKKLNKGFYSLYEYGSSDDLRFYACSETDTILLIKNDSLYPQSGRNLSRYQKLAYISKDYPELWPKANALKFEEKAIQHFISEVNAKYSDPASEMTNKDRFSYLSLSLRGFLSKNRTDIRIEVLKSHYSLAHSPDISLRYGISVDYYKRTVFVPESFTGFFVIHNGITDSIFNYRDHDETLVAKIIEFPFSVNFEITNSLFTPYFYAGLAPVFYSRKISRTDSEEIENNTKASLNAFAAAGLKLKLTDSFNIMSEGRIDMIKGFSFLLGVEYYFL